MRSDADRFGRFYHAVKDYLKSTIVVYNKVKVKQLVDEDQNGRPDVEDVFHDRGIEMTKTVYRLIKSLGSHTLFEPCLK